jgi:DNA polymerase III sliding clamp (beta) subunit (PCNA family)
VEETESKKEDVSESEVLAGLEVFNFEMELEPLKEAFNLIKTHVDEAMVWISEEQWYFKFVDPAHVLMGEVRISNDIFSKYNWKDNLKIGVDTGEIYEFLKICSDFKKEWIKGRILTTTNKYRHSMELTVDGHIFRTFDGANIENMTEPKIPNLKLPLIIPINSNDLRFGLKQCEQLTDWTEIVAEDKSLKLRAKGEMDVFRMLLKNYVDSEDLPIKSMFSLDYMWDIAKNISSDEVIIKLGSDYPIEMKYMIAEEKVSVILLFAPRIDTE